jgi:hypothetical protein
MKVPSATRASCLFVANKINNLAGTFFLGALATKQSILSLRHSMDCFAEFIIGRAFARPGGSQ